MVLAINPFPEFRARIHGIYSRMKERSKDKYYRKGRLAGRVRIKGFVIPFSERELEEELIRRRTSPDKPYQCRYCSRWITLMVCVLDHTIPLKQAGSPGLDNLEDICGECNDIKGGMLPDSFKKLLAFIMTLPRKCAIDMRTRLQRANKHAGQVRSMAARLSVKESKSKFYAELQINDKDF